MRDQTRRQQWNEIERGNMNGRFDHEKLDVYRLLLEFISWVSKLLEEVKQSSRRQTGEVRDQLHRASLSALLNMAELTGIGVGTTAWV